VFTARYDLNLYIYIQVIASLERVTIRKVFILVLIFECSEGFTSSNFVKVDK
jgi:hypothetical protein